jgi:curved DNA-binding protein CbpA
MNFDLNYYAILGVIPTAEDIVIRAAYKALAQRYHPDRFKGSPEELHRKMAEINDAYSVLSDSIKRQQYDKHRNSKMGEGDDYFDEKSNDVPPEYDPLEQDWSTAVKYYPDLLEIERSLARIAWRLAYSYRACLLESKSFANRNEIAYSIKQTFFTSYFGKNEPIIQFAKKLIDKGHKKAARELNKAVRLFGEGIDAEIVIAKINQDYDPFGDFLAAEQRRKKEEQAAEQKRKLEEQVRNTEITQLIKDISSNPKNKKVVEKCRLIMLLGGEVQRKQGLCIDTSYSVRLGDTNTQFLSWNEFSTWIMDVIIPQVEAK